MAIIKTYPEMNKTIKDLLRLNDEPMDQYILARIEELEKQVEDLTPPPNDPLTLEELRKMDGKPVWVVGISAINNFKGHWDICDWENDEVVSFPYCMEEPDKYLYGVTWRAYRQKPEVCEQ